MSESFEGRKVVVVGGSSGMGLATTHRVVAGGGIAVITGRDQEKVGAGSPNDIANAVSCLPSDKSSWMTGAIVEVDGGTMAGRN